MAVDNLFVRLSEVATNRGGVRVIVKDPLLAGIHERSQSFSYFLNPDTKPIPGEVFQRITGTASGA